MERKLASVRRVNSIFTIPGADSIESAFLDGWRCIVKKDEFRINDLGVYFEVDSVLPIEPRYEFLRKNCFKKLWDGTEGFRLKTMKMRGTISQGLLLPLTFFLELKDPKEGDDMTSILGIRLYETPMERHFKGVRKGNFPAYLFKTDQERIQNIPDFMEAYKDTLFEVSIKLDGSSMTVFYNDGAKMKTKTGEPEFGVCSHTCYLEEDEKNSFWMAARKYKLLEVLQEYKKNIALQGELVGEKIQGNNEKIRGHEFYLFDIWSIDEQRYLTPEERGGVLEDLKKISMKLGTAIQHVPILGVHSIPDWIRGIPAAQECPEKHQNLYRLLASSEIPSMNPNSPAEGLVFKSMDKISLGYKYPSSFKVLNNKYLLFGGRGELS